VDYREQLAKGEQLVLQVRLVLMDYQELQELMDYQGLQVHPELQGLQVQLARPVPQEVAEQY
jgi:hypothetical protein